MYWQQSAYALVLTISAIISAAVAVYAWRRRATRCATPLALFMLAAALWSLAYALEVTSTSLAAKVFWAKVQYLGIVVVAPMMLVLVLQYTGRERWLTRRNLALLAIMPLFALLLVWTNQAHGLIWTGAELSTDSRFPMLDLTHGPFFWVPVAYSYVCLLLGTILLLQAFQRSPRLYRAQTGIMLLAMLVPWAANALYLSGLNPFPHLDLTSFAFIIAGLAATWGLLRFRLLDIVPIGRDTVIENMADGVIVLDEQARILDANPVARGLIGDRDREIIGQSLEQVLSGQLEWVEHRHGPTGMRGQIALGKGEEERHYDLRTSPLLDRLGQLSGQVVVMRDNTALRRTQLALQESQEHLKAQNTTLRRLAQAVEQSASIVIITDLEGRIEYANRRFEETTGYPLEEVIGESTRILKSGEQSDAFYAELWHTITSGLEWRGEFHNRRKDGTLYWEQATIAPIFDATGQMTHFIAVKENTTERKQVETALNKLLDLSRLLVTTRDLNAALAQGVASAIEIVSAADGGTLQWLDDDGETLRTVAFSDAGDVSRDGPAFRLGEGVAGHALASRQIINVPDVLADERFVPGESSVYFRSLLVAPLVVKDRTLGTLSLSSAQIDAFSPRDEILVGLVADQTAAVLEVAQEFTARRQAEETLHRQSERLKILHEIGQSVLAARLPENIAVAAIGRIRHLIPCQRAMVLASEEDGQLRLLAAESSGETESRTDLDIYEELFQQPALASGWVHGVEDLATLAHPSPMQQALAATGVHSYVVVPLFIQGNLVGTLNLESERPKAFTSNHIAIATEVAASLAVAIRQARLYAQAQQEITERMQAEAALRRYAAELEAQNAELDAFAHTVAHDLKNPLSTLIGYAELLQNERFTPTRETLEEPLRIIERSGLKMSAIISDLLLLASVRQIKEIKTRPLDMGRIVTEAQDRVRHLIEQSRGQIVLPDSWPVAVGYGPWVEAVWTNYISNALKYGGQPPRVELGAVVQPDGWIRFWVRDNGPGLSAEERARLFTPFERLHELRVEGHGLGLSIVQRVAKKLGGQVGVESPSTASGQGSTFYFTLPGLTVPEK